jgi:hypothetical protein
MNIAAKAKVQEASIAAVVIRADGTREDLGVVSYWNKNPLRRFWWRLRHGH